MVTRVFNFVYREVRGLHQAAYILALFALGSQLLAIVRDRLLAHTFGAGRDLDMYYAAFKIPDLLYVLFASVLSIYVLLPFVNRYTSEFDAQAGARVLTQVFSLFLIAYSLIAFVLLLMAPYYVPYVFPGFAGSIDTLITMQQILLLQPLLLGVSNLCGVVTQMNHRFILYALSPLLYNVGIIIGIIFFYPVFGLYGLAGGVVIGALGHLCVQVPFVYKSEYRFGLRWEFDWTLIRNILSVSIPRAITMSTNQVVLLVLISMASLMTVGSVSVFQFAFNLQSVPLAIIGMSYSVAAFPTLSYLYANQDQRGFNRQLITAMRHIIFWSFPVVALVIVLRAQIIRVLLGSGAFDWGDTRLTAAMLAIFVVSLLAQAMLLLLIRAFYAGGKTFLPLVVAVCSGMVTLVLAMIGSIYYQQQPELQVLLHNMLRLSDVPGSEVLVLALAFVCGQGVQLLLMLFFSAKLFNIRYRPLLLLSFQSLVAAVAGGISAYAALGSVVNGVDQETFIGISLQGVVAGLMGVAAIVLAYTAMGSKELKEISRSFQSKIFKTDIIAPQ